MNTTRKEEVYTIKYCLDEDVKYDIDLNNIIDLAKIDTLDDDPDMLMNAIQVYLDEYITKIVCIKYNKIIPEDYLNIDSDDILHCIAKLLNKTYN